MAELRFEKLSIPGSNFGPAGRYPILYKQKMFEKTSLLSEDEGLYINYGNVHHTLPYTSLDTYDRALDSQQLDAAVLENEHLKAVFVPQLGGRLWSLYDKKRSRDLVVNNPVFRPCNFAVRNAWVSGGVEWNCGVRGHSALTCDRIFAARAELPGGEPVLRMYAFERIRAVTFQMDFFLDDTLPFLFARMRLVNGANRVTPIYWWSTLAVEQKEGARVIVPADEAYVNQAEDPVYKTAVPMADGLDLSYPTNHTIVVDHFYKIPESARKYEAYVDAQGIGIIHASTRRQKGRKLFVWGTSTGGDNWQKFLTGLRGYNQPYLEIQAGLAPTQNESLPMPPATAWEWMETYGAIELAPAQAHGGWQAAQAAALSWLDHALPEPALDSLLADTKPMACTFAPRVYDGAPWGELDNRLRRKLGQNEFSPHLDFGPPGEDQQPWLELLQTGSLPEPDPETAPASYLVQPEWFALLREAADCVDANNWFTWYQLGLGYYAQDDYRQADDAFTRSMRLRPSSLACHALANTARLSGRAREGALLMFKAYRMDPGDLSLAKEALRFAYEAKQYPLMLSVLGCLDERMSADASVRMYRAFALAHTGELAAAKAILTEDGGLVIPDLREGDDSLTDEYIWMEQQLAQQEGRSLSPGQVSVPESIDFRMFHPSP